ncbi:ThiF family adenylyltransferase [Bacillus thermotolerans]|uniref:ThiF family adenylyltransferase n=1 Tax=Bacillus thermotolerans TaxID=1221996 RepID=UPI0005801E0D|nr:ThiF family adenylyltransferase [Bacillus thermotolerans]KKB36906.1 Molybdopterin biosynthesis protein MoeB [Bacillus thermotolerans]
MDSRYSRQMLVSSIGKEGQEKLSQSSVLIIGGGALGSHTAEMCARMGISRITILDRDYVDLSNLQRQTLFTEEDVHNKEAKAYALEKHLKQINSSIHIEGVVADVNKQVLEQYIHGADIVLDCTDNFDIRFLLNEACIFYNKKWIFASCAGTYGNVVPISPGESACLDCLFIKTPFFNGASCDLIGVQTTLIPLVTSIQCSIMVKMLIEQEQFDDYYFYQLDSWKLEMNKFKVHRHAKCPACVEKKFKYLNKSYTDEAVRLCGRETVQFRTPLLEEEDFQQFTNYLGDRAISYKKNKFIISFKYKDHPFILFKDGRLLIHEVPDIKEAKQLYYQLFS